MYLVFRAFPLSSTSLKKYISTIYSSELQFKYLFFPHLNLYVHNLLFFLLSLYRFYLKKKLFHFPTLHQHFHVKKSFNSGIVCVFKLCLQIILLFFRANCVR